MQTKELIEALRANADTGCSNEYHVDVKNDLLSQAADALEATLWRDDVENAPKDRPLLFWDRRGVAVSGCWHVEPAIDTPNAFEPGWSWWVSDNDLIMWEDGSAPSYWISLTPPEAE